MKNRPISNKVEAIRLQASHEIRLLSTSGVLRCCFRMRTFLRLFSRTALIASAVPMGMAMSASAPRKLVGQNPVEALTKQHNWIFAGYMLLLVAGLILTYWVWRSGNRVQDAIQADANARIVEAVSISAQANERARSVENDNLKLRGELNTQTGKVAGLEKAAADAKADQQRVQLELAKQQTELAKQQKRAADAEHALLELQQKTAVLIEDATPRTVTAGQRDIIKLLLTAWKDSEVTLSTYSSENEARTFSTEIEKALSGAGLKVNSTFVLDGTGTGFGLAVHSKQDSLPLAETLARSLLKNPRKGCSLDSWGV